MLSIIQHTREQHAHTHAHTHTHMRTILSFTYKALYISPDIDLLRLSFITPIL